MNLLVLLALFILAGISVYLIRGVLVRRRSERLMEASVQSQPYDGDLGDDEDEWLARRLSRAGFRDPAAVSIFVAATAGLTALGLAGVFIMNRLKVVDEMVASLQSIPGGIGDLFALIARAAPYFVVVILAFAPTLIVRAARRNRVESIEQDLAPTLELLATLAEAGLSFDSAIARVQESESGERPLSHEIRIYQRDVLGGFPRLQSLRRLAHRVDLTSVSIFVSALIQAEQVGASLGETLRTQADDLRDRRKLHALLLAQALPVKLVFPLIFCFLPGIFYSVLGPVISQFVDVADSVIRRT